MAHKVAVVTGGNKGIGFAIVKGLCERYPGVVYLTSRDTVRGQNAVKELNKLNLKPEFHQLDITDKSSIERFRNHVVEKYGGIDILINNAAIAFKFRATEPVAVQAEQTCLVNYFSLVSVCDILSPIIRNGGRIVNVSSSAGLLSKVPSKQLRNEFKRDDLTIEDVSKLMTSYVEAAQRGTHLKEGWGNSSYETSKVGVTAVTFAQQRKYGKAGITVNCCHPGYVDTDLTSHQGPWTIEQGAVAPLYLALDAPDTLKGKFVWCDTKVVDWDINC